MRESKEKKIIGRSSGGCINFQHSILTKHAMNNDHKVALQDAQLRGQFTRCMEKNNGKTGSAIKASFNIVFFIVKEEMPLAKFGALVNLQITNGCNDFKNITHQHHSHVTETVEIISACIEGKTISILRKSPFVGALLDKTSNIRVYKKLVIFYPCLVTQCSSQSAPLRESRKRSRDGPQQKRLRAIMALSFFNSLGLKMLLLLELQ